MVRGRKSWSRYWRSGQTYSCFADGKPFEADRIWTEFFEALPIGTQILDLACGAGALSRLALSIGRKFEVTGVDYASMLPKIDGVKTFENVFLERLPFPDNTYDAVMSQFGLEYADTAVALAETVRVMKPGAAFAALVHDASGEAIKAACQRAERVKGLLEADGVVGLAIKYEEELSAGRSNQNTMEILINRFNIEATQPRDETTHWALGFLGEIINKHRFFPPAYFAQNMRTLVEELNAYSTRLELMIEASKDEAGIAKLADQAQAAGLRLIAPVSVSDSIGNAIGWWLSGSRL